ncbi:MAG: thioredoxin domain-containing protein, partial [Nanoarchaeota archaeon]|nr:thioredoxin domain-containing protein [Nanoarchaeota archaeon]
KKTANIKENKKVKKPVSKKPVKKQDVKKEKHVSDMAKEDVNSFWKIIAGIAVVIFLILMVAVLASMNSDNAIVKGDLNNDTSMSENYGDNMSNTMEDSPIQTSDLEVSLLLIEDPACTTCQVDLYVSQLKEFLFPNLKVEKLSLESEEAKDIIEELGIVQVPVYLFSDNLDQLSNWETDLADKFAKIPLNSKEYFALNPLYIPIKSLVNKPIIDENTVVIGNKSAKLTIYEFSDYECPYCAIAEGNEELLQQYLIQDPSFVPPMEGVFKDYVETGKVKFVFFNLPLEQLHPDVMPAHLAAMCANNQDKWLDFHKKLFKSRSEWVSSQSYTDKMKEFAKELGLDEKEFASCLDSEKYLSQIENEIVQSFSLGVTGTPAFVVGNIFVPGVRDYTVMKAIIEEELNN